MTAESLAIQIIEENQDLAQKYAGGDFSVLGTLEEKATQLAAGRVNADEMKNTLVRKLGASI